MNTEKIRSIVNKPIYVNGERGLLNSVAVCHNGVYGVYYTIGNRNNNEEVSELELIRLTDGETVTHRFMGITKTIRVSR